jgi:hypothetical protein
VPALPPSRSRSLKLDESRTATARSLSLPELARHLADLALVNQSVSDLSGKRLTH